MEELGAGGPAGSLSLTGWMGQPHLLLRPTAAGPGTGSCAGEAPAAAGSCRHAGPGLGWVCGTGVSGISASPRIGPAGEFVLLPLHPREGQDQRGDASCPKPRVCVNWKPRSPPPGFRRHCWGGGPRMGGRDVPQCLEAADLGGHGLGHHRAQEVTKAADGGTEAGGRGDRRTPRRRRPQERGAEGQRRCLAAGGPCSASRGFALPASGLWVAPPSHSSDQIRFGVSALWPPGGAR